MKKLALIGAGGHADAVFPYIDFTRYTLIGYFDDKKITTYNNLPIIDKIDNIDKYLEDGTIDNIFITIGENKKRSELFNLLSVKYYNKFINIIADSARILSESEINARGLFIGHNTFLGVNVNIGDNSIVNTGTIVEHHSSIGKHCNLSPGVILNGTVSLKEKVYVGSGSIIIQNLEITNNVMIGAGGVVVKSIDKSGTYVGVPVKKIEKKGE